MNWDKAKNITIVIFLILNIILGVLINKEKNNYTLSSEQINIIYSFLKKNNVLYKDNILIKNYKPMKQISALHEQLKLENILDIFIRDKKNIKKSIKENSLIFENNIEKLIFYDNKFIYKQKKQNNNNNNNYNIEEITNNIIKKLNKKDKFIKDNIIYENNKIIIEYREKYKKNIIYDNYILFKFNNKNLEYVEYSYNNINRFLNKKREIVSLDAVLLTFVQKIKNICQNKHIDYINIEKIDIVYSKTNINFADNQNVIMVPFYRIYYKINSLKTDVNSIMMINAYTNVIH